MEDSATDPCYPTIPSLPRPLFRATSLRMTAERESGAASETSTTHMFRSAFTSTNDFWLLYSLAAETSQSGYFSTVRKSGILSCGNPHRHEGQSGSAGFSARSTDAMASRRLVLAPRASNYHEQEATTKCNDFNCLLKSVLPFKAASGKLSSGLAITIRPPTCCSPLLSQHHHFSPVSSFDLTYLTTRNCYTYRLILQARINSPREHN